METYLALPDGAGWFTQDFSGPALLRIPLLSLRIHLQDSHLLRWAFPEPFDSPRDSISWSYYPATAVTAAVWAASRSLATTWEITLVFFSSAYLDVSVRRVRPPVYTGVSRPKPGWVAPFGNLWINASWQLPTAYRSFARPSSPLHAKASTLRPL